MGNLLEIKNLIVEYKTTALNGESSTVTAVNDVTLDVKEGEILALAGESGCGKSTLAKAITKLVPAKSGVIFYNKKNIFLYNKHEQKDFHKNVQMVFQNPYSSLNPKMKIKDILKEPLDINTDYSKVRKQSILRETLHDVGLQESVLDLYPHEFSGGQRQRIAIARALVLNPKFIIADEPVSALDASIQAQIINLFAELKKQRNLTILFISHDLNVIRYLADRVCIMYHGKIVEENDTISIFNFPKNDYTKTLLSSAPNLKTNF